MKPDLTLGEALLQAAAALDKERIDAPRLTAEVLLAHAVGRDRTYLFAHADEPLTELAWIHFGRWLHERIAGKPTQLITGKQEFYGREFRVRPGVLIPRPETEHVIEHALPIAKSIEGPIVDVGTGSGCIAITLSLELKRRVYAVDIGPLDVARENSARLNADVVFWQGDLLTALRRASLVVTNPPYVPSTDALPREVAEWEPHRALFSGVDGLDAWRSIITQTPAGAWLVGEIDSRASMRPLFDDSWADVAIHADLAGRDRIVAARRR